MAADRDLSPAPPPAADTRRSALWALGGAQASALVTLGSSFVLARLLQPHDTGTYAMAGVLVALANLFRDFGVGTYVVQEPELTPDKLRAALAVALATAWTMAVLLWLGAAPFAALMGEPGITPVLHILALNFLVIPFGSVAYSVLRRAMAFRKRALIETASIVAQATTSIILAARGLGAEALAWGSMVNVLGTVAGTTLVRPRGMPWRPSLHGVRRVLQFGAPASAAALLKYLGESLPTLVVGRGLGAAELGLFRRAQGLAELLAGASRAPASNVMLPALGHIGRDRHGDARREALASAYLRATTLVAGLMLPFALVASTLAQPLVRLLYGPTWLPAVPMVLPLALATLASVPQWFAGDMLLASGKPGSVSRLELVSVAALAAALLLALPAGPVAAAWAVLGAVIVGTLAKCTALSMHFGISHRAHLRVWWSAIKATLPLVVLVAAAAWSLGVDPRHLALLAWLGLIGAAYVPSLRLARHPLWGEADRARRAMLGRLRRRSAHSR